MSIITVKGVNPFSGQADPYVGVSSSVNYGSDGIYDSMEVQYTLNGALTGCSLSGLQAARDDLTRSFDWKADPTITGSIVINGVTASAPGSPLVPSSLSFDSNNYLGSLSYSLVINLFTGYSEENNDDEQLFNKVHTETINIDESSCVTKSVNISCTPNLNLTGCDSIQKANQWISGQLNVSKLGSTRFSTSGELNSESLTINPRTSQMTYNASFGDCKEKNTKKNTDTTDNVQICEKSETANLQCSASEQIVTTSYDMKAYKPGATQDELITLIKNYANTFKGVKSFSANYDKSTDTMSAKFTNVVDGSGKVINEPKDLLIAPYSKTVNTSYAYNELGQSTETKNGSVNGQVVILGQIDKNNSDIINYDTSTIKDIAKSAAGPKARLTSENVTTNEAQGTKSFSYSYAETHNPQDGISLDGYSGVSNYTINYTPALQAFDVVPNLNCDDLIFDKGYATRGNASLSLSAVSGSGYNFEEEARELFDDLKNQVITNQTDVDAEESEEKTPDNRGITLNYTANFIATSAIDKASPSTIVNMK